tara:strand:- start:904 stop:1239 length:336 start_codon:yes stop_codon:yes gene_type:complete
MNLHKTGFNNFLGFIERILSEIIVSSWRRKSVSLISLLVGFYLSSSATVFLLEKSGQRIITVAVFVLLIEILTRVRIYNKSSSKKIYILVLDNARIGMTYAIVLEAFKLGS